MSGQTSFPIGCTLDRARYTITECLAGTPARGLYRGRETTTGVPVLVTLGGAQRDRQATSEKLAFEFPRVAKLRYVGELESPSHWSCDAMVEDEPRGRPASEILRLPLQATTAKWIALEVARIAKAANEQGVTLSGLRPELIYLWGTLPQVAGVAPRCEAFLATAETPSSGQLPCFEHLFASPEALARPQNVAPLHADAFSLFAILAYWLTGDYPFEGDGAMQILSISSGRRRSWRGTPTDGEAIAEGLAVEGRADLAQLITWLEDDLRD